MKVVEGATKIKRQRPRAQVAGGRRAHNALHTRDLRQIDTSKQSVGRNPAVVVRQHVIVCNFPPIRCIIVWDRLLVLLPGDDAALADELATQLADQLYAQPRGPARAPAGVGRQPMPPSG